MAEVFEAYRQRNQTRKFTPFVYTSAGLKTNGLVQAARCNVVVLTAINPSRVNRYFQLHEQSPVAGSIPSFQTTAPAGGQISWNPSQGGRVFERLFFAVSSTAGEYTPCEEGFWVDVEGMRV